LQLWDKSNKRTHGQTSATAPFQRTNTPTLLLNSCIQVGHQQREFAKQIMMLMQVEPRCCFPTIIYSDTFMAIQHDDVHGEQLGVDIFCLKCNFHFVLFQQGHKATKDFGIMQKLALGA
jgi:hypothetical protein